MKQKVYIETTIVSYLTANVSRDLILAGRQQVTQEWWERESPHFDLFVSEYVIQEVSAGNEDAAKKRLAALAKIPSITVSEEMKALGSLLLKRRAIPEEYPDDAFHIAISAVGGIDYLLTWNFAHMVNVNARLFIESVCLEGGYRAPIICTPEELIGG